MRAGLHACIVARDGLDTLSRERVRMELLKLFVAPRAAPTLTVMAESGLLGPVLGGVPYVANFAKLAAIETAVRRRARSGAPAWRAWRHGARGRRAAVTAPAAIQRRIRTTAALDGWWLISPSLSEQAARALLYQLGPQSFADRVLHAWAQAEAGATDDTWQQLLSLPKRWTTPTFPLKSADFTGRGVPAGPALGAAMRAARDAWIAADFPKDRAAIEAIADHAARAATSGG